MFTLRASEKGRGVRRAVPGFPSRTGVDLRPACDVPRRTCALTASLSNHCGRPLQTLLSALLEGKPFWDSVQMVLLFPAVLRDLHCCVHAVGLIHLLFCSRVILYSKLECWILFRQYFFKNACVF